ncbi:hypothetical protein EMCRGX_G011037 [Ephydatia muelleri]
MGRALVVVLVLNVLESFVFFQGCSGMFSQVFQDDLKSIEPLVPLLFQMITNSAGRLVYPFAGFLADAYLTRGRVIHLIRANTDMPVFYVLQVTTFVIFCFGMGSFEANVIPFGADQLQGVSSEEESAYFYWYYWTRQLGNFLGIMSICAVQFEKSQLKESMEPLIGSIAITLGIVTYMIYNKSLLSAGPPRNPLKLVVSVIFYAATLKRGAPLHRRAFRYGEEKKGRMELAKKEFDGKFESEEVEDVKTFYRILMMFLPMGIFYIVYYGLFVTINYEAAQLCIQLYQPQNAALQYIIQNLVGFLDPFLLLFIIPLINFVAPHFLCFMSMSLRFRVGVGYLVILMAAVSLIFTEGLPIPGHGHLLCLLLPLMLLVVAEALSVISALEFIYAQSPEQMRGLLTGLFYLMMGIFMCTGSLTVFLVQHPNLQSLTNGIKPSFILSLIFASIALLGFVFYVAIASIYKNRQRPGSDEENLQIHTNRDRTDPNYRDWSKYQAKSIKLGMNRFSTLFSQKAEASMDMHCNHAFKKVDNLIYQMGNVN